VEADHVIVKSDQPLNGKVRRAAATVEPSHQVRSAGSRWPETVHRPGMTHTADGTGSTVATVRLEDHRLCVARMPRAQ
jgi:hypothetical protein